jgi:NADH:flavin oxidoreductases, Old Yellow Enzyme family
MTEKTLLNTVTFGSGITIPNRIAMAPMLVFGANPETGQVTKEDLAYFETRNEVAGLVIVGASFVTDAGHGERGQIGISDDADIIGLTKVAKTIKARGNRAIIQLHHAGREANAGAAKLGYAQVPSDQDFPWLNHFVKAMSEEEIDATIEAFGEATHRAIVAGFDGVEVHGANHYLLQQFFSEYSNHRNDKWGGNLEKRMAFPLAVLAEVKRVAATAGRPFAVGYRISPEEVHGDTVGYTIEESKVLMDRVIGAGVDYLHISLFSGFSIVPKGHEDSFGQIAMKVSGGRCPIVIVSDVFTEHDAIDALRHGDIVAIGRAALIEPKFAAKIIAGHPDEIETSIAGRLDRLAWPKGLIAAYTGPFGKVLPPMPGIEEYSD